MYAVINKYGWVVQVATKDLGKAGFTYVKVQDEEVKKALLNKETVHYVDGNLVVVEPVRSATWDQIRKVRESLFVEADAALFKLEDREVIESVDLTADKALWAQYRQALRDVTEQSSPDNVTWPSKPSGV